MDIPSDILQNLTAPLLAQVSDQVQVTIDANLPRIGLIVFILSLLACLCALLMMKLL